MWDIKIGKSTTQVCSATIHRELDEGYYISRNSESYWITETFLDIGAMIFKGTREYDRLKIMLADPKVTNEQIRGWIDHLVIRKAPVARVRVAILNKTRQAHRDGRYEAKNEVRNVLMGG